MIESNNNVINETIIENEITEVKGPESLPAASVPESITLDLTSLKDDKVLDDLYAKLGRPETAEAYELKIAENAPVDKELLGWFKNAAFASGLSAKQAQKFADNWQNYTTELYNNYSSTKEQSALADLENVKKEWGNAFNENIKDAKRATSYYNISAGDLDALENSLGTAKMLTLFNKIGKNLKEANFIGQVNNNSFNNPDSSQDNLNSLLRDKNFMSQYLNGDKSAISQINGLMQNIYSPK